LTGIIPDIKESEDILSVDVYDASGTVVRSFRARYAPDISGDCYTYTSKGRKYRINARTGEAEPEKEAVPDAAGFRLFKTGDKYGIKKADGPISVQPVYGGLYSLGGGLFAAAREKVIYRNNWGVIDGAGKEIIPFIYESIHPIDYPARDKAPLLCRQHGSLSPSWLVDRTGHFVTPQAAPYENDFYFNAAGQSVVRRNGKYGVIDHTGKEVLPCLYETVFDELSLRNRRDRRKADGAEPNSIVPLADILYRVERNKLWGLYDGAGRELIPVRYGFINFDEKDMERGWVDVRDEEQKGRGLVNFRTGQVIQPRYGNVEVCPGFFLAWTQENNRDVYILLDKKAKETARYERAEWFADAGVAAVKRDGKSALLDKNGKQRTPFRYDDVFKSASRFVWCKTDTGEVLVDGAGKEYRITANGKSR
jgi:hypothetical protein